MIHCLHGAVGSYTNWDIFKDQFDKPLATLDLWSLMGNGAIDLHAAGKHIAASADEGDILMGYSMGGRLALHALLATPKKWRTAIIIAAHPGLDDGHDERVERDARWAQLAESDWNEFLKQWDAQPLLASSNGLSSAYSHPSQENQAAVAQSFRDWSLGKQDNLLPDLLAIECPVLWIVGSQDEKFLSIAEDTVPKFPDGRMVSIPNAGHRIPWQQPDLFAKVVKEFVQSV